MKHGRTRQTLIIVSGLVAVLAAFIYHGYHRDIVAARIRVSSGSQIVKTPCGVIEYGVAGNGPPVLLVHGAGGGFDQGLDFGRPLVDNGYTVIAPSRFGYLRTPLPSDASPIAQAEAHRCLLDALNLPTVAVFGGSMGAPSAMQLCLRHPDRCSAMVLGVPIAFAPLAPGERQNPPSAIVQLVTNTILGSDFAFWVATKLARDTVIETILATPTVDFKNASADEQERVLRALRNILPIHEREKGLKNDVATALSIPRYDLEHFAIPTLVISAEDDRFGTFERGRYTAQHIPGARFAGYPTGGHLWVGHQKDVWSECIHFLRTLPEKRRSTPQ